MDNFKVIKNKINLIEIKVEDHPIKIEPEYKLSTEENLEDYSQMFIASLGTGAPVHSSSGVTSGEAQDDPDTDTTMCSSSSMIPPSVLMTAVLPSGERDFNVSFTEALILVN